MTENYKVLELFSGIGGMHWALKLSGAQGEIKSAIDINPNANNVYKHNFPDINVLNKNIQSIDAKFLEKLGINMILMSPPCQPFTRVGKKMDMLDNRTDAFKHICNFLPSFFNVNYILMENVKGFENSDARNLFIETLIKSGFYKREFILSPSKLGIPNTRHRYFCIARRNLDFPFEDRIWDRLPGITNEEPFEINKILENDIDVDTKLFLSEDLLRKRIMLLDIVTPKSKNSICFTKAYTHYSEGTGSILSLLNESQMVDKFNKLKTLNNESEEYMEISKSLKLRYFTPREVLRLMSFPEEFKFPDNITNKQKYKLLGNSINVFVVSELIKFLIL